MLHRGAVLRRGRRRGGLRQRLLLLGGGLFRGDPIAGICITSLPDKKVGSVMLGSRVLVPGDVLTAEQAAQMTFSPRLTELDESAEVGYLPSIPTAWRRPPPMTIGIRGKENQAPRGGGLCTGNLQKSRCRRQIEGR